MAIQLSIDLSNATFADLRSLVDAARTAGVDEHTRLELEDTTLIVTVEGTDRRAPDDDVLDREEGARDWFGNQTGRGQRPVWDPSTGHQLGDAAIRSVIDILTGRQEPPRSGR